MNGQQYLQAAASIAALAPVFDQVLVLIANTVRGIEAAFPASTGKEKLDAALGVIGTVYESAKSEAAPLFTGLINTAVAIMNVRGELDAIKAKSLPPTPVTAPAGTASPSTQPGSTT